MAEGVLGRRVQVDSIWNIFFNETGMVNGCKAGDLKVTMMVERLLVTMVTMETRVMMGKLIKMMRRVKMVMTVTIPYPRSST